MFKLVKHHRGTTLLEMIIALFVMGVGLMGVLGMQTQSIRFNHQAYSYSQAVFLAQDIMESIRANKNSATGYKIGLDENASSSKDCSAENANCNPSQLKDWDVKAWREKISERLPGGKGAIAYNAASYTITIEFDLIKTDREAKETAEDSDAERETYTLKAGI